MAQDEHEMLELLKFELNFVEDGGYGGSPRTPWRPPFIFEDSPSCLNLGDPARTHPCSECLLLKFVPDELQKENSPCRFIPLNENGETIDYFYRLRHAAGNGRSPRRLVAQPDHPDRTACDIDKTIGGGMRQIFEA